MSRDTKRNRIRKNYDIDSFLRNKYDKIINRVNGHGHSFYRGLEVVSREEFYSWSKEQGKLYVLYHNWSKNYHKLPWQPTIDRIDSKLGYTIGNMRWLTHRDNSKRIGGN